MPISAEGGPDRIPVALEIGRKRVFASAIDWPGWARSGKDDASALQALVDAGPRYARVVAKARMSSYLVSLGFRAPKEIAEFKVVERLKGNATTDFGAPGVPPKVDLRPMSEAGLRRDRMVLEGCWRAFDRAVDGARGRTLRKGPRGGGRPLAKIVQHVVEADAGYLSALGWKYRDDVSRPKAIEATRKAMLEGIAASARGEIPAVGPRGGKRWSARFFVRRSAWHVLDHAWEIEDRAS
jgi:hypothetical protein